VGRRGGLRDSHPFRSALGDPVIHIKAGKARTRRLEDGEEQRTLDAADPCIADLFTGLLETGCRPGELRTFQWADIHKDHFVVLAAKAKDREEREITITPTLQKILQRRRVGPDGRDLPATAYVFGNETGEVVSRRRLCSLWLGTCGRPTRQEPAPARSATRACDPAVGGGRARRCHPRAARALEHHDDEHLSRTQPRSTRTRREATHGDARTQGDAIGEEEGMTRAERSGIKETLERWTPLLQFDLPERVFDLLRKTTPQCTALFGTDEREPQSTILRGPLQVRPVEVLNRAFDATQFLETCHVFVK
jgi:hypothetical protein